VPLRVEVIMAGLVMEVIPVPVELARVIIEVAGVMPSRITAIDASVPPVPTIVTAEMAIPAVVVARVSTVASMVMAAMASVVVAAMASPLSGGC
jgi:hypothetical protein